MGKRRWWLHPESECILSFLDGEVTDEMAMELLEIGDFKLGTKEEVLKLCKGDVKGYVINYPDGKEETI